MKDHRTPGPNPIRVAARPRDPAKRSLTAPVHLASIRAECRLLFRGPAAQLLDMLGSSAYDYTMPRQYRHIVHPVITLTLSLSLSLSLARVNRPPIAHNAVFLQLHRDGLICCRSNVHIGVILMFSAVTPPVHYFLAGELKPCRAD